jgi:hypothetical protein
LSRNLTKTQAQVLQREILSKKRKVKSEKTAFTKFALNSFCPIRIYGKCITRTNSQKIHRLRFCSPDRVQISREKVFLN